MKSVLITGANKGIGFETARQLLQQEFFVYLGCRDLQKGLEASKQLNLEGFENFEVLQIDITQDESVRNARTEISKKTAVLDVLINNAAISGGLPQTALTASIDEFETVFDTNLYGVVRTTQIFLDLLQKSTGPFIINVSSSIGSLTLHNDPTWQYYVNANLFAVYSTSKAALNMYSVTLAHELRDTPFKICMVDPGYTKTDFNGNQGLGTVEDAAARIVNALRDNSHPTGSFTSEEYNPETGECPW